VVRVYDKTVEIGRRGLAWLPDLWGEQKTAEQVWRIEAQFRRAVLSECGVETVDDVLDRAQGLWRYATQDWLTYRRPMRNRVVRRWPVDDAWRYIQSIEVAPRGVAVVRQRTNEAEEMRLVQGLQGYLSSLAALHSQDELDDAWGVIRPLVVRYFESKGVAFRDEVRRKRERRLEVSGPAQEPAA
jgi:hypothetical protein